MRNQNSEIPSPRNWTKASESGRSALEAAEKLETNYEQTKKSIQDFKLLLAKEKEPRKSNREEDEEDEVAISSPNSEKSNDCSVEFNMSGFDFNTSIISSNSQKNKSSVSVQDRLLSYGEALKQKKRELEKQKIAAEVSSNKPDITDTARSIKRDVPIQDLLMSRYHEKEARLDEMRREKDAKEMKNLSSPRISKLSRDIKFLGPAHERLQDVRKHNMEKREQLKNELLEREKKEQCGTPNINPVSKTIHRNIDNIIAWGKERDEKIKHQKEKIEQQEKRQLLSNPKINSISDRIASQMGRNSNIHEHLLAQGQKKQRELEEKKKRTIEKEMNDSIPLISAHSANLYREGEVFDRLYYTSIEQENRKREIQEFQNIVTRHNIDPTTGHKLFSPSINPRSSTLVRTEPVQDILLRKADEAKRKIEQSKLREFEEVSSHTNEIKALPYSQLLADLMERRTNTSTMDRLTKPRDPKLNMNSMEQSAAYTFQPRLCTKSREIDYQSQKHIPREQLLIQKGNEYKRKKSMLKQEVIRESLSECTFSPRSVTSKHHSSNQLNTSSIAERSFEWSKKVEKKVLMERKMLEKKEVEDCTFKPSLSSPRKTRNASIEVRSTTPPPEKVSKAKVLTNQRSSTPTEKRGMNIPSLRPPSIQPKMTTRNISSQNKNDKENYHPGQPETLIEKRNTSVVQNSEAQIRKPLAQRTVPQKSRNSEVRTPQKRTSTKSDMDWQMKRLEQESGEIEAVLKEREEERRIRAWEEQQERGAHSFPIRDIDLQELKLSPEVMQLLRQVGIGQ